MPRERNSVVASGSVQSTVRGGHWTMCHRMHLWCPLIEDLSLQSSLQSNLDGCSHSSMSCRCTRIGMGGRVELTIESHVEGHPMQLSTPPTTPVKQDSCTPPHCMASLKLDHPVLEARGAAAWLGSSPKSLYKSAPNSPRQVGALGLFTARAYM